MFVLQLSLISVQQGYAQFSLTSATTQEIIAHWRSKVWKETETEIEKKQWRKELLMFPLKMVVQAAADLYKKDFKTVLAIFL